jgi:hypothetical protein
LAHSRTSLSASESQKWFPPQSQQHRVVDDASALVSNKGVLALAYRAPLEIARCEHVREAERVRTADLNLALGPADVPHGHSLEELPVLLDRIAVEPRVIVVVIDAIKLDTMTARPVVIRGLLDPGVQQDPRMRVDPVGHRTVSFRRAGAPANKS